MADPQPSGNPGELPLLWRNYLEARRRDALRVMRMHYAAAFRDTAVDVRREGKLDDAHLLELMADDFEAGYPISKLRGYRTDEDADG